MTERMIEATFVFIDLAGFTALTETHGDERAADLAERFHGFAVQSLDSGDRMVKSIGDAVMLTSPEPVTALSLVERILDRCSHAAEFPIARTGLHHGHAVQRGDDVFGAAVNLAARVAAHAAGDQALATADVAECARRLAMHVIDLGQHQFRNIIDPVSIYEIRTGRADVDRMIDPVCRMSVVPSDAAGHLSHAGTEWWFCSLDCIGRFASGPDRYLS